MIYTKKEVSSCLRDATREQTEDQFVKKATQSISDILENDPIRYRYYGVFWWVVKKILLDSGASWLDDGIDKEWLDKTDFGDTASNLAAAWMISESRMANMETPSNSSMIEIEGENKEYILIDDFMEQLLLTG